MRTVLFYLGWLIVAGVLLYLGRGAAHPLLTPRFFRLFQRLWKRR